MRILINSVSAHMGGAVTYLNNILQWLPRIAPGGQFIAYVPIETRAKLQALEGKHIQLRTYPYASTQGAQRVYFDQVEIAQVIRKENIDVLFSATGFGTWWGGSPEVLLIRNMAYFDPQFHAKYRALERSLTKNTLRRWHSLLSAKSADAILFPTKAMQKTVASYIDLKNKNTAAIHYGFDRAHFFVEDVEEPEIVHRMRAWKAEGEQVLLGVSTYAVHKNYETLIEALPLLRKMGISFKLVTTTSRVRTSDKKEYDALQQRTRELDVDDRWVESGYVDYEQLQYLYQEADAYVFPSFTESFGHSLVEAMASGCPIVAADTKVNREVCGRAGEFFESFDSADCAQALKRVLISETRRDELGQASVARATHFSWKGYAEQLMNIFRETANLKRKTVSS